MHIFSVPEGSIKMYLNERRRIPVMYLFSFKVNNSKILREDFNSFDLQVI